jgi:hypothetical protein
MRVVQVPQRPSGDVAAVAVPDDVDPADAGVTLQGADVLGQLVGRPPALDFRVGPAPAAPRAPPVLQAMCLGPPRVVAPGTAPVTFERGVQRLGKGAARLPPLRLVPTRLGVALRVGERAVDDEHDLQPARVRFGLLPGGLLEQRLEIEVRQREGRRPTRLVRRRGHQRRHSPVCGRRPSTRFLWRFARPHPAATRRAADDHPVTAGCQARTRRHGAAGGRARAGRGVPALLHARHGQAAGS